MSERVCGRCGAPLVLSVVGHGYTHADGPDRHVPTPVRPGGDSTRIYDQVSMGRKRPSGEGALFTRGDGR